MPTYHLSALTLAGAAIGLAIESMTPPAEEVDDIELPNLALAKGSVLPKEPGEVYKVGRWAFVLIDDLNTQIVDENYGGAIATQKKTGRKVQTVTITYPPPSGLTNGETDSFSGYVSKWQRQSVKTGERALINCEVTVAGNITKTAAW